ncbi:ORF6N domain-containing protein [Adlercreutzia sp. ZJ141]|uniref:ORF6N domain-containing protein n=1 Tax=Adlercreutzia sp. ZJ141 TaxID=2709406 RepID=UPI0013EDD270|nr:ORF6N domain-containing protein [Adlercreutzia sp. ZJ141]
MVKEEKSPSVKPVEAEEDISVAIVPANEPIIRDLIYTVRGTQVMLDSDLARLYQVETGALNRAAKRNEDRFPEDFRFRLTREELDQLRCQIGILAGQDHETKIGRTYMPFVYTEQGVAMLSGVLRSAVAVQTSIRIMRAFVEMRHFIASNAAMFEQVRGVELKLLEYQRTADERFERVFDYMNTHEAPRQKVFFDGQVWDAFELLVSLVHQAEREIVLIDGYVDTSTLSILAKKTDGVNAIVWTHPRTRLDQHDIDTFNAQYSQLEIRHTTVFHDRFLIIDGTQGYFVGASLKDAGKKSFAISRIEDYESVRAILARLER